MIEAFGESWEQLGRNAMADTGPQNRWAQPKPIADTFGARTAEQQNKSTLFWRLWTNLFPFCNTSFSR